jgi:hypothetical protein
VSSWDLKCKSNSNTFEQASHPPEQEGSVEAVLLEPSSRESACGSSTMKSTSSRALGLASGSLSRHRAIIASTSAGHSSGTLHTGGLCDEFTFEGFL